MKNQQINKPAIPWFAVQGGLLFSAFLQLVKTDAFFAPYLLCFTFCLLCLVHNAKKNRILFYGYTKKKIIGIFLFAALFALMITLANYSLLQEGGFKSFLLFALVFCGTWIAFSNLFLWISENIQKLTWQPSITKRRPYQVFLFVFCLIALINLTVLFLCKYPGNITNDSVSQLTQITTGVYSNHHPFYQTLLVQCFVKLGMTLFHSGNAAVAFYFVFQILFMAACFSYSVMTLYERKVPIWFLAAVIAVITCMPYHILYSMSMWKDVMFGGFVLLFIITSYRITENMGSRLSRVIQYLLFALSGLGFCLFRSNGLLAYIVTMIAFFFLKKGKAKRVLVVLLGVLAVSIVLKYPILQRLHVTNPDTIESMSIPAQQISRAVTEDNDLTEEERAVLERIIDIDKIPDTYNPHISDPIKNLVRERLKETGYDFGLKDLPDFAKIYLSIGARHPVDYAKAWVEQTKGYWNAGYGYWVWLDQAQDAGLGIYRNTKSETLNGLLETYFGLYRSVSVFNLFISIGLFVWFNLMALFISIRKRDKTKVLICVPTLAIVLSLLISTPIYSEFRYVYSLICALPFIIGLIFVPHSEELSENRNGYDYQKEQAGF